MRRKDRAMDRDFALSLIDRAAYGVLSMAAAATPYGIPLSLVRIDDCLYFHAAKVGRKVDILAKNDQVSVAFIGRVAVPEKYSAADLATIVEDSERPGQVLGDVFTTEFESAIVAGRAQRVEDRAEKERALLAICQKYTPTKMQYADIAIRAGVAQVAIYKIKIETLTAKRKKI